MLLSALQTVQKRRKREINYVMSGTKRENETDESQKLLQTKGRTLPWYSNVRFVCFWSAPTYPKCLISLGVVRTRLARGKARRPEIGKRSVSPTHVPSLFPPPPPPPPPLPHQFYPFPLTGSCTVSQQTEHLNYVNNISLANQYYYKPRHSTSRQGESFFPSIAHLLRWKKIVATLDKVCLRLPWYLSPSVNQSETQLGITWHHVISGNNVCKLFCVLFCMVEHWMCFSNPDCIQPKFHNLNDAVYFQQI